MSLGPYDSLMQFFDKLPVDEGMEQRMALARSQFRNLALFIMAELPANPERTVAMRKLLEAKDCAIRALLFKHNSSLTP